MTHLISNEAGTTIYIAMLIFVDLWSFNIGEEMIFTQGYTNNFSNKEEKISTMYIQGINIQGN